ncbi:hypothetical protein [Hymenobacter elongatus]|uniref:Uncharacterized protein n=1 Tax=Hymenobacter elongatus TaxID=877208 RepID=A0A4Z0PF87_9BACT|nr:hypothetical protein [Hymenobacter elongatus]TGE13798.1 hypothetical protein E5J99_18980 [Hymenobacter elongatus]
MKNYCSSLLICLALASSVVATAQQGPDLRVQATENTRKLSQQISLDDARTTQVKRLTYERLVQENDVKQMYSIDPAMLQSKLAVIEKEYAEKLQGVLSAAQYQRYVAITTPVIPATVVPVAPQTATLQPVTAPKSSAPKPRLQPKKKVTVGVPTKKSVPGAHASTSIPSRP